jgi:hypothetical protein
VSTIPPPEEFSSWDEYHEADRAAYLSRKEQASKPGQAHALHLAALLDEVRAYIRGYVIVTAAQADALTLWAAHTHVLDAFETTPFLALTSPTKRCGKSRALDALELVVARPWRVTTLRAVRCEHFASTASTLLSAEKAKPPSVRGFLWWAVLGSNQ